MSYALLLLQDTPVTAPDGTVPPSGGMTQMLLYVVGIFAIFYFMLIRPQRREAQRREQMLSTLKKHDQVVTHGGMIGQLVEVGDDFVTLKVDDDTRIRFKRAAIAGLLENDAGKKGQDHGKTDSTAGTRSSGGAAR
jgi:preprotein translocase subunit YajC